MHVTVRLQTNRLGELGDQLARALTQAVRETLDEIETNVAVAMGEPKSGRMYRRGERWHQASAPGEAPARDMGALAASVQQRLEDHGERGAEGLVYTNAEIAPYLEYGTGATGAAWPLPLRPDEVSYTTSVAGMAPRPYMTPAGERARAGFERRAQRAMVEAAGAR